MVPLQYAYFLATLLFSLYWVFLFVKRNDLRKGMLSMGCVLIISGVVGQYYAWTVDWWNPQTITNTKVGIEDVLHAFTGGGIAIALYPFLFKKKFQKKEKREHQLAAASLIICTLCSLLLLFFVFTLHSFYATLYAISGMFLYLMYKRGDLFFISVISGFLLMVFSIPVYIAIDYLSPEFLISSWNHDTLSEIVYFHIPLEDLIFYFITGTVTLPFYLYWKGLKLGRLS